MHVCDVGEWVVRLCVMCVCVCVGGMHVCDVCVCVVRMCVCGWVGG